MTMRPVLPTLLLLSLAYTAGSPGLLAAAGDAARYTTPWADSTRLGDTIFHSSGQVITTVAVRTDSHWVVGPSAPPVKSGLPYGPSQLPPDSLCSMSYY